MAMTDDTRSPIRFHCAQWMRQDATEICAGIADAERWSEFEGWGPVPGIASAAYEVRTDTMTGSRIRVLNRDGSSHVEEITAWEVPHRVALRMHSFTPPLDRVATHFVEEWRFSMHDGGTLVERSFALHACSRAGRAVLWLASWFLRRAVARHMRQIHADGLRSSSIRTGA